jgi:hypothetical protein
MVDQTQVTATEDRTELPPRAVARGSVEFLHDVTTLAELQGKLFLIDFREGMANLLSSVIFLMAGTVIALGCIPVFLAGLALTLEAFTELSLFVCFWISLGVGFVLAAALAIPAYFKLKKEINIFERSTAECRRNVQWVKDTLKRLGQSQRPAPACPTSGSRW